MTRHDDVSDEQVMIDLHNTAKEFNAYCMLVDANTILRDLPENSNDCYKYNAEIVKNEDRRKRCHRFLKFLEKLADERGLTWNDD